MPHPPPPSASTPSSPADAVVHAPWPRAAHQRRPIAGEEATPTTGTPSTASAMSVPHTGHAAQEVRGAVDRVDDPLPGRVALGAELLAEDAVARAGLGEPVADGAFDREIGLGDRRAVGFRLHVEVDGAEPGERDGVGEVGEFEGEIEVFGVVGGHPIRLSALPLTEGARGS